MVFFLDFSIDKKVIVLNIFLLLVLPKNLTQFKLKTSNHTKYFHILSIHILKKP